MRSSHPHDSRTHCPHCFLRREICICLILPSVKTKTEFLILRHIREARHPGNTGRLVTLAMPNARIIDCGGGDRIGLPFLMAAGITLESTWLLWPDGPCLRHDEPDATPPRRIVVLDATWHQARRLFRHTPLLQAMPRLSLPEPSRDRQRLRKQRRTDGMSTLEAVAAAVALLEGAETARPLENLYDEVVRRRANLRWGRGNTPDVELDKGQTNSMQSIG